MNELTKEKRKRPYSDRGGRRIKRKVPKQEPILIGKISKQFTDLRCRVKDT